VTGALAVLALHFLRSKGVTGGGYETLSKALVGQIGFRVLLALCAMKVVATVASYGSGGAGGIFAPSLFIGGMLGGAVGFMDVAVMNQSGSELGAFALVGMGAVFAGIVRAPITSVLIIFEMTGGYGLILPLMIANMMSYGLARHWRPVPIYEALLEQDGILLPRIGAAAKSILDAVLVESAMTRDPVVIASSATVAEAQALVAQQTFSAFPIVDELARFVGMVSLARLRQASEAGQGRLPARDLIASKESIPSDEPVLKAVVEMSEAGVRQLAVVHPDDSGRLVGILAMSDVLRAQARAARETTRGTAAA
jgi:CIC family chloride channel protein